jgi:hypothetical protein
MLLLGAVGLAVVVGLMDGQGTPNAVRATPQKAGNAVPSIKPAVKLKVRLGKADGGRADMLDPKGKGWETVPATRVLLNRTPRVYQTEKPGPAQPSTLEVRGVQTGKQVIFRLTWKDSTQNAPKAPPRRADAGSGAARLYKRPTGQTSAFADAAAVMVPVSYQGGEFPSLMMGDAHGPVRLYYWNASRGAEQLTASGRGRVEALGKTFRHQARYDGGQWALTLEVPELPTPSPVAFAVWDGEVADRNGRKMFSIWYVLE